MSCCAGVGEGRNGAAGVPSQGDGGVRVMCMREEGVGVRIEVCVCVRVCARSLPGREVWGEV